MNDSRKIRKFGIVLVTILFIIGTINLFKANIYPTVILYGLDLFLTVLIIVDPVLLKPIYKILMFISHIIGWINTRLLLGIIYYLVFTPIGIVLRIFQKDPLNRRFDRQNKSYWILYSEGFEPDRCERQY